MRIAPARAVGFALIVLALLPAAASGAVRYAAPGVPPGGGDPSTCPESAPCYIEDAVEHSSVQDGDEVVVLPGTHSVGSGILSNPRSIHIHGAPGGPLPVIEGSNAPTVLTRAGLLSDVEIRNLLAAGVGLQMSFDATVERVRVVKVTAGSGNACTVNGGLLRDSVCMVEAATGSGARLAISGDGARTATLHNVTAVAPGPALRAEALGGGSVTVIGRNVIASGNPDASATVGSGGVSATIDLDHSNYDTESETGGGTVTDPGTLGNQMTPPLLADLPGGDFHQLAGSPTIDAGTTPSLLGTFDFEAQARTADGNCDGSAIPDIGADEFIADCPGPVAKAARTVALDANKSKVIDGKKVRLSGEIVAAGAEAACAANQAVELQRKRKGAPDSAFKTVESLLSDGAGGFTDKERITRTYIFRAVVDETAGCEAGESGPEKVRVKKPPS